MIRLVSKDLSPLTQRTLGKLQDRVNAKHPFIQQTAEAKALWLSKGGAQGKKAFEEVRHKLNEMCVSVEVCNYCEQNEGNDIEHIYPKSFFPESAFNWNNYLLACKQCNSGYKLDKCFVLDKNDDIVTTERGSEPAHKTVAFIDPRSEDPSSFLILNMETFTFDILPDLSKKDTNKAQKTTEILELNKRDTLLASRKSAAKYFYERMERLVKILDASSVAEIEKILTPYDSAIDKAKPIDEIKLLIKQGFKKDIVTHQHPSVWHAIKVIESKVKPPWGAIFAAVPESLNW